MRSLLEVAQFMSLYAAALDRRDLEAWVAMFAPQASYQVESLENQSLGLPLKLIDDPTRSKLEDRVLYIRRYWSGCFNEYTQRHLLSLPVVSGNEMEQNFAVYVTDMNFGGSIGGRSSLLCVGRYLATFAGDKLGRLQVILDTSVITQSLVYPV
jgi:3-phenylpropionate/cinnamic acid dioxygenase small subunit